MKSKEELKVSTSGELLSYMINELPGLGDLDLPVQGESIKPYGKIIMGNERYKNAFINACNLIGLTAIKRNIWKNPWGFTNRGTLRYGQQIREIVADLANVYDYNEIMQSENKDVNFLNTVVPNVLSYMHEVNFQKFYKTTTSDEQMAMAFENDDLFGFIDIIIGQLYESLEYDTYLVNKYMLCRRLVDGTVTSKQCTDTNEDDKVAFMKEISDDMTFRSPEFNPAGLRKATSFDNQRTILNTKSEARISTKVLAKSYFKDQAELRTKLALIDGFDRTDEARLTEVLGKDYIPFTTKEKEELAKVIAVILSDEWFMDYDYAFNTDGDATSKKTMFENPETLETTHWLHKWAVFSTSPFENACVITASKPDVTSVKVNPGTASVSAGQTIQLSAAVETTGFANKAVKWSTNSETCTISKDGILTIPAEEMSGQVTVTATSIYKDSVSGTATITVVAGA